MFRIVNISYEVKLSFTVGEAGGRYNFDSLWGVGKNL